MASESTSRSRGMFQATSAMPRALFAASMLSLARGLKYRIHDSLNLTSRTSYSEGWMYGSKQGPKLAPQGSSYVDVNLNVTAIPWGEAGEDVKVNLLFYRTMTLDWDMDQNINICPDDAMTPDVFMDTEILSFPASESSTSTGDGTQTVFMANVAAQFDVEEAGLMHTFFQVCPTLVDTQTLLLEGELTFRNPYGYLPGMDYGCLPFELFRVFATLALGVFFSFAMWRHRTNVLPVHKMIIGVVILSAFEALAWFAAYSSMNKTGQPYCCPYPGSVIAAMLMEVLRRTVSRFMLLMICLGYGITRIELEKRERFCVITLTVAFLVSGMLQLISSVGSASHVRNSDRYADFDPMLTLPALLTDMVYLVWIYGTLANMIKELKEINETYKLKMYKSLAWTLGAFVTLFTMLTVLMLAAEGSPDQSWEWKWEWIQVVSWEILNFCMLVAVSIIWRPSPRSAMLAYSKQLATNEIAADEAEGIEMEGVEMQGPGIAGSFVIGGDGDSDEERSQDGHESPRNGDGKTYSLSDFEPQRHVDFT